MVKFYSSCNTVGTKLSMFNENREHKTAIFLSYYSHLTKPTYYLKV